MRTAKCVLAVACLGMAMMGLTGCGPDKKEEGKAKKPPFVQAIAAEKTRLVELLETTGDVVAVNAVTLHATVEGPISFCPWREGDRVEQIGQKLIEIDRPLYRQEVSAAEAALVVAKAKLADLKAGARPEEIAQAKESVRHFEDCTNFAKADYDRTASLVKSGALPPEEVEKARVNYVECQTKLEAAKERVAMLEAGPTLTQIAVAQATVEEAAAKRDLAQAKLDECVLKAPFSGVITEVLVRPGDLARPQAPLLKMMDPSSLVVRAGLPESCSAHIREGTDADIRLDAYPGKKLSARIERIYPRLEWDTRTRIIEARVIDPVELIPHLFARLWVRGRVVEDAVAVPDAAIVTTPRGHRVIYVAKEGKAQRRTVTIGLEEENRVQVIDGVQVGEMVIISGNLNLKDGAQVRLGKPPASIKNNLAQKGPGLIAKDQLAQNNPGSNPKSKHPQEGSVDGKTGLQRIMFQNKFPVRLREYNKDQLEFRTLDEVCQYFHDEIEKHPFARYIGTFDHYSHTMGLKDRVVDPSIIGAKNIIFCFGKILESPETLSVRPRSIGVCETESQWIISFLEAPSPVATETMERWVLEAMKPTPNAGSKQSPGGESP
ncbi:MAG: efflux RND transporter periplasmic adaptor subunit [Pirellulales bacterium]|nr:efflux RND transporter periplasmic adaptor subunit [Pirellulales bacterium]